MRVPIYLGAVTALVAMSLPAQRTQQEQTKVWDFLSEKYDANSDGVITAEEYGRGAGSLASYDHNSDGVVTADDFSAQSRRSRGRGRGGNRMTQTQADQMVARGADSDGSRDVSPAEWKAALEAVDSGDGGVVTAALTAMARQANGTQRRLGGQMQGMFISAFDVDKDGNLTVYELTMAFARLDKNQDNTLQWSELGLATVLPQQGDLAPDFVVPYLEKPDENVKLSSFAGDKPVALVFGSYT